MFNNDAWLTQIKEEVIDPDREIVDAHHHLWPQPGMHYDIQNLLSDTNSGHNIVQTVFAECGAAYRISGPEHLKCVGETEFVAERSKKALNEVGSTKIAGIVGYADLTNKNLDEILEAHEEAGNGLFKGIRHSGAHEPRPEGLSIPGPALPNQFARDDFKRGVARLGELEFSYDTWIFHHQIAEFRDLAEAVPNTIMILDHFGTPLGVGHYAKKREEIYEAWKEDIEAVSKCENVFVKLGGMAMPDNGYGWENDDRPPTSDEFIAVQERYYDHTIKCFGPGRCIFESNFPVDRLSLSYRTLWNAFKKIAKKYSEEEQDLMFSGVARKVYRL